jgi:hypothetical protein
LICLAVLILTAGAAVLVALDVTVAVRPLVVFIAALIVPGVAIGLRLPQQDGLIMLGLVVTLSLAIEVLIALVMVWARWWHPDAGAGILAGASVLAIAADLRSTVRGRAGATA